MAQRKRPQTGPVKDSSAADNKNRVGLALPRGQFDNIIRFIKSGTLENVMSLRNATFNTLKRLGVPRNKAKTVAGIPAGSDQIDLGSIVAWMGKVEKVHRVAVKQIVAIDATCVARSA